MEQGKTRGKGDEGKQDKFDGITFSLSVQGDPEVTNKKGYPIFNQVKIRGVAHIGVLHSSEMHLSVENVEGEHRVDWLKEVKHADFLEVTIRKARRRKWNEGV